MYFEKIGLKIPNILLPKKGLNVSNWAIVACDQYTSQPNYWDEAKELVGDEPSTLNLIYPEVYLEEAEDEKAARIASINSTMQTYLDQGVFEELENSMILVDRKTSHAPSRKGLVVALDLEKYDYNKGSQTLVRATEGTILDRIPPRVRIREHAPIELPHIMVLIDDPDKTVIEPLFDENLETVYDVDLMKDGGHIKGYRISDQNQLNQVATNLEKLAEQSFFNQKYGVTGKGVLLYAMGDGNHSLATAKAIWETLKKEAADQNTIINHPARFALVELVNVHDAGLVFEPIHRVVFDVNVDDMLKNMQTYYQSQGSEFSFEMGNAQEEPNTHVIRFSTGSKKGALKIKNPTRQLHVGTLQSFLDDYLKENKKAKIDYIHGEDVVTELSNKKENVGFYLPAMSKHDLFKTVIVDGALPRKTFSMGEAEEKRFYLECRRISY